MKMTISSITERSFSLNTLVGWVIFTVGAIFYSYEFLLRILPSVMTTDLMRVYHLSTAGLSYLAVVYYVIYTAMQLPVGLLIDWYGPKRLLLLASSTCAIGSFLFASFSLELAALGRFFIGLGSAFGFVGVLRLASLWLPANRFALATGLVTTLGMIGGVLGNLLLSHVVVFAGWHSAVLLSAWIGLLLMIVFFFIPDLPHHHFAHATHKKQWLHLLKQAIIIARMPTIWLNALVGSLLYVPLLAFGELWGVSYLETTQNISSLDATWAISWLMWGWAIGAPFTGWLANKIDDRYRVFLGGSLLSFFLIIYILHTHFSTDITLFFTLFLFGLFCSGQILAMVIVYDICPTSMLSTGLAITNMIIMASGIIFQPFIGIIMRSHSPALAAHSNSILVAQAYTHAMYVVPFAIFLGILALFLQKHLIK